MNTSTHTLNRLTSSGTKQRSPSHHRHRRNEDGFSVSFVGVSPTAMLHELGRSQSRKCLIVTPLAFAWPSSGMVCVLTGQWCLCGKFPLPTNAFKWASSDRVCLGSELTCERRANSNVTWKCWTGLDCCGCRTIMQTEKRPRSFALPSRIVRRLHTPPAPMHQPKSASSWNVLWCGIGWAKWQELQIAAKSLVWRGSWWIHAKEMLGNHEHGRADFQSWDLRGIAEQRFVDHSQL